VQAFRDQKLHDKYGPVVRVSPHHLIFTDSRAWKDIYGHLSGHNKSRLQQDEMIKSPAFCKMIPDVPDSIVNADREEHGRIRRALSHGFSDSSLRQQEHIVVKYVDHLLDRLHEESSKDGKTPLNVESWYNWTTFDITGDLIFGQSFGCLEGSDYHPWIEFMFNTIKWGASLQALHYLGLRWLVRIIVTWAAPLSKDFTEMQRFTQDTVRRLLKMEEGCDDLFEGLIKRQEQWVSFKCLRMIIIIIALLLNLGDDRAR
jgi:cytochrome P450